MRLYTRCNDGDDPKLTSTHNSPGGFQSCKKAVILGGSPSHKGFRLARERLGLPKSEIWHAGFGFKYDIVPATELGYTTVWVNRQGEARPVNVKETFLVGDMQTLVYLV